MSLLSIEIPTLRRLSLGEVNLSTRRAYPPTSSPPPLESASQEIDRLKLIALAQRVVKGQNNYSQEELIELISKATNITRARAERGFYLMLEAGALEHNQEIYYLGGDTPF